MDFELIVFLFIIFILMIISYIIKDLDFVAISLLCCFIAATVTGLVKGIGIDVIITFIQFEAIILILSMIIITKIAEDSNILEYIAVKLFKISKGNQRVFFWLICIVSTLLAAVISDVVVILILAPIVIRLCRFLKTKPGTYLLGMTICINIGSIITPFSSGENIIISTAFNLDVIYFIQYFWIFSFFILFLTIFLLNKFILSKEPIIEKQQKKFVLELISAEILIKNKKIFYFNGIMILSTIILFVILPLMYLTAAISAMILVIVNKKFTKKPMKELLKKIDWDIIFFFIALYIVVGCLLQAGFREIFESIEFKKFDLFFLTLMILIIVSLVSGFVANTPTALIFIPIIDTLISTHGFSAIPLLFAFIIGINLGGNLLPQGAACDLMTLKIAQDNDVENLNFKRLFKMGLTFAIFHILLAVGYLFILVLIFG
ncbi:MAG: SLC13 family permease [Candidatus Hodarchaeota archaeon]